MPLNLRSVDLNLLPVFDAIMEAGQLSRAGKRLERELFAQERLVVIARKNHPQLGKRLTRTQFLKAQHVVLPTRNRQLPLDQLLREADMQRRIVCRVSHMAGILAVCQTSNAIGTVPASLAAQYAEAFKLNTFPFPGSVQSVPMYLVYPKTLKADRAHQ